MKNNNRKILVSILTGAMLLTSATTVSAASVWGSRSSSMMGTGMTETYAANNLNQYTTITGGSPSSATELTYDLDGNMTRKGDTRYYYDIQNRLVAVTNTTTDIAWSCEYDVFGNRTKVIDHGTAKETLFVQGSLASAVADYDASGSPTARHILLGSVRLADITTPNSSTPNSQTLYYHADGLASTRLITDANGDTIGTASYRAFGEVRTWGGPSSVSATAGTEAGPPSAGWVGTLGVERDDATGLVYMRNRYYDAEQGRFIQMDPIRLKGCDFNFYRYCYNVPVEHIDIYGTFAMIDGYSYCVKIGVGKFEAKLCMGKNNKGDVIFTQGAGVNVIPKSSNKVIASLQNCTERYEYERAHYGLATQNSGNPFEEVIYNIWSGMHCMDEHQPQVIYSP